MVVRRNPAPTRTDVTTARAIRPVHYPASDGKPMGETETHIREIMRLIQTLDLAYEDRPDVCVGGDLLLYYIEARRRLEARLDMERRGESEPPVAEQS